MFAILYYTIPNLLSLNSAGIVDERLSFGRALYFSIVTFTTLGYGDIRPAPGLGSFLAAIEAILGGAIMALTVMLLGRKFMR